MAMILISHNLGMVAERCDRVVVMYAGKIVEIADSETIFEAPVHPYTQGLIRSIPWIMSEKKRLEPIKGDVPDLIGLQEGCHFAPRCENAKERCFQETPEGMEIEPGHYVGCHFDEM